MHTYIAAVTTAQEAERGRLARELHDETVQQLIVLAQGVDRLGRLHSRTPERVPELLATLRGDITSLIQALRVTIANLRPPALEELGLLPAVELFLQPWAGAPPAVTVLVEGAQRRLDPESELAVFRIIQEAWSNIRRHAQATRTSVRFSYDWDALRVTISDNGLGFIPPGVDAAEPGHWGVLGMRERAALAGGSLEIASAPGQGAQVALTMPYPGVGNRDHVCGMAVRPGDIGVMYQDQIYRFCSLACKDLFLSNPERYLPSS
jgi:two-component system, NarL family, sensor histidine kinase UhpB